MKLTYKQIEASREARLWVCQIVLPALTLASTALAIPEVRQAIANKFKKSEKKEQKVHKFTKHINYTKEES